MSEDFRLYNCKDALATVLAEQGLRKELEEEGLEWYYNTLVQPLAHVILNINSKGIWVDVEAKEAANSDLEEKIRVKKEELNTIAGKEMPIMGDAVGTWLFEELGLPKGKRSVKTKKWSTDEKVLRRVIEAEPKAASICNLLLEARGLSLLKNTFLRAAEFTDSNGRLHPNFRIGPVTGRLSCARPNLQNVPPGTCRSVYAAPPGFAYIGADYSQLELRIFAILSKCKRLLDAFAQGKDVHAEVTKALLEKDSVTKEERREGKRFVFGMIYGAQEPTLVQVAYDILEVAGLPSGRASVRIAMTNFFAMYPEAKTFMRSCGEQVLQKRKMYTAMGRPRIFFGNVKDALGEGGNYPMQGGASEIVNRSMIELDASQPDSMVLQVHDFILLEVPEQDIVQSTAIMKEALERPVKEFDNMSFPVEIKVGKNWAEV